MTRLEFSPEMIAELDCQRYHHPHPRVQQKMEVLYLKSQDVAHQEIPRLCQISSPSQNQGADGD